MTITLYGHPRTRSTRVLWALLELGLTFRHEQTSSRDGSTKTPDFLALNPNGKLPTLDDDGFRIWESMAINLYLAKKYGCGALYPEDLQREAKALQWSIWAMTTIETPMAEWSMNAWANPEDQRDPEKAANGLAQLMARLPALEVSLADCPYLLGDEFTVADLNVAGVMDRAYRLDLANFPRIAKWFEACWSRPSAKEARRIQTESAPLGAKKAS